MEAQSMFSTLLQWLASATGDEAKTDGVPLLDFMVPDVPLKEMRLMLIPQRPMDRLCCAMGQRLPQRTSLSLDPTTLWNKPHTFRARAGNTIAMFPDPHAGLSDDGGTIGFVYTRHGGFIDLGHARDLIDYTIYFASMYRNATTDGGDIKLFYTGTTEANKTAYVYLSVEKVAPPPNFAVCALIGAKLAFELSLWHEIESYFTLEKYSSFAPEDLFSNAVGVLAGFRALVYPVGSFDSSADSALKNLLQLLGAVDIATTTAATQYVEDHWWKSPGITLKRNFLARGAIKPWLVTDLAISGRELQAAELAKAIGKPKAASITIPTIHQEIFLQRRVRLVLRELHKDIKDLTGVDELTSINLQAVSTMLRDYARVEEGVGIDQP
jgi:hypothetical protein